MIEEHDRIAVTQLQYTESNLDIINDDVLSHLIDLDMFFRNDVFGNREIVGKRLVYNMGTRCAGVEYKWLHDVAFDVSLFALNTMIGKRAEEITDITFNISGSLSILKTQSPEEQQEQSDNNNMRAKRSVLDDYFVSEDDVWRFGFYVKNDMFS